MSRRHHDCVCFSHRANNVFLRKKKKRIDVNACNFYLSLNYRLMNGNGYIIIKEVFLLLWIRDPNYYGHACIIHQYYIYIWMHLRWKIFLLLVLVVDLIAVARIFYVWRWMVDNTIKSLLCAFYDHSERMAKNHNIEQQQQRTEKKHLHISLKWHINVC